MSVSGAAAPSRWLPGERIALALLGAGLALLYFGFFNHDFSVDGLRYATQVEAGAPLFHPNHLLPNALFWLAWKSVRALGFDVRAIWVTQAINALAGIGTALCLARALATRAGVKAAVALAALYAVGFAAWNFAQEPEVYVLPALAVAASLALLWRSETLTWSRIAALIALAVFAVLCLQQYVFWYPVLLALLWQRRAESPSMRRVLTVAVSVPALCLVAYLAIGAQQQQLTDLPHAASWFLGYAWDAQQGFGTYRAAPDLLSRVFGLALGLGNLLLAYEILLSPWAIAAAAAAVAAFLFLLWRGRRVAAVASPYRRDALAVLAWTLGNLIFAFWWESRDIEFLLPVWLGVLVLIGLARVEARWIGFAALIVGAINLCVAFGPQREWPQRYRIALNLARHAALRPSDVLITDELNTVGYLAYFHDVKLRFLPGAVSAAMHAAEPVPQARAALDRALADGARVYTTEPFERGRLYRIAEWLAPLGRPHFDGGIERDLEAFYSGLALKPGPVEGITEVAARR